MGGVGWEDEVRNSQFKCSRHSLVQYRPGSFREEVELVKEKMMTTS